MNNAFKGFLAGCIAYLICGLIAIILAFILYKIYPIILEPLANTVGLITSMALCFYMGSIITVSYIKKAKHIVEIIIVGLSFFILTALIKYYSPIVINLIFYGIFGAFIGLISHRTKTMDYVLMYSLPSFRKVPKTTTGIFINEESKIGYEMSILPEQSLTAPFIIIPIFNIIVDFNKYHFVAILGAVVGLVFSIFFIMVTGSIIRKFLKLDVV